MTYDHITLPVSALKSQVTAVFSALAEGRTVYVSKYGDVVAAFRPIDELPEPVAAAYSIPGAETVELTARDMGRSVPSEAVTDAANGLPSLVTKDHEVYGVLTEATAPTLATLPDLDLAAERFRTVGEFLQAKPEASLNEIVAFRTSLDQAPARIAPKVDAAADFVAASSPLVPPEGIVGRDWPAAEVTEAIETWVAKGSGVEDFVVRLFDLFRTTLDQHRTRYAPVYACNVFADVGFQRHVPSLRADALTSLGRDAEVDDVVLFRELRQASLIADTDPVVARTHYVTAMVKTAPVLNQGAMWRLGDLARAEGLDAEARVWYVMALAGDAPEIARGDGGHVGALLKTHPEVVVNQPIVAT